MTIPLGRLATVNPGVPEFLDAPDDEVTFLPLECVWPDGKADITRRAKASAVAAGYTTFRKGDVLIPKITPTFEAGRVMVADLETDLGAGTTELHTIRPIGGVDPRFLAYVCRSHPFLQDGATRLQGVGNLRRVPAAFIAKFPVAVGDTSKQSTIADYLDRETAQIDTLIEEQRRLVELLRERRSAAVEEVFARQGANYTRVGRLLTARPRYGVLVPRYTQDGTGTPLVRVGDLSNLDDAARELPLIPEEQSREFGRTVLEGGEVLLGVVGKMGQAAVVPPRLAGANVARAVCVLRCASVDEAILLRYWLGTRRFLDLALLATSADTVQPTLGMGDLARFPICWPSEHDQTARLVSLLNDKTARIDALIAETERFVELSRERRGALITAAVTGQIDVSGEVA